MSENYAEVIPSLRLPKKFEYFDYILPDELKNTVRAGSIVFVPFRGKNTLGLVTKIKKTSVYDRRKLKVIKKIVDENIILPEELIKIIFWLKNFLGVPTSLALKTVLPEIPKNNKNIEKCSLAKITTGSQSSTPPLVHNDNEISDIIKKINESKKKIFCIKWGKECSKNNLIFDLVSKNSEKQLIILEPRLRNAQLTYNFLKRTFGEKVKLYHKKLNKNSAFGLWKDVLLNKTNIIVTTRAGIFFPMNNLDFILFSDEEDPDFKSADQSPYYDSRTIGALRSNWSNAKLLLLSQSPRTETFELAKRNCSFYEIDKKENVDITVIDIRNSYFSTNSLYISNSLREGIVNTLQNGKKVILFLNRKGESTFISCRDCGFVWKCKNCTRPLVNYGNSLQCNKCKNKVAIPLICEKCKSTNIVLRGIGTQKLEKELIKFFPNKNILRIDKDSSIENKDNDEKKKIDMANIIVGTEYLFKNYLYPEVLIKNIGLVTIPVAENLFSLPDFRTDEKAYAWIIKLKKIALNTGSKMIIQSFFPENENISMACGDNLNFYEKELKQRNIFLYPPYSILLKIFGNKKIEYPFFEKIKEIAEKNKIQILEPEEKIKNKKKEYSIILKIQKNKTSLIPLFVDLLDERWNIDINPI